MSETMFLRITVPRKSRNGLQKKVSAILSERRRRRIKINNRKQIITPDEENAFFNFKIIDDIDRKGKMTLDLKGQINRYNRKKGNASRSHFF